MSVATILLAAGLSRRFGTDDKLAMPLGGVPLGQHAARTLLALPFDYRIVVTAPRALDWQGFATVQNAQPEAGMSRSLALGVKAVRDWGASAVLVALADMPFVSVAHFTALLACHRGSASITASSDGTRRMPPALFGSDWFPALESLDGDAGARQLLADASTLIADVAELIDVDDPACLHEAERRFRSGTIGQ